MTAIIWREIKVSLGSLFGVVMQFSTPVFMMLLFATAFAGNIGKISMGGSNVNYLEFFAPGLFGYMTFYLFSVSFSFLRIDSRTGMLSIIALSKASINSYFWGKYYFQLAMAFLKIIMIVFITVILTKSLPDLTPKNILILMPTLLLSVAIWYGLGMLGGIYIHRDDLREVVVMLITLPLTFASSMYYSLDKMPGPIKMIAIFNPLTYTCNLFRGCYLNKLPEDYLFQLGILLIVACFALSIALVSLKKVKF